MATTTKSATKVKAPTKKAVTEVEFVLYPRVSEKAYMVANNLNTYVFNIPLSVNKPMLKVAVEAQYAVTVETVNIVRREGKKVNRAVNNRGLRTRGQRLAYKKAYVSVKKGDSIPVFAAEEGAK